jgi:two-component system nitrogen regulation response regulator GlnG
MTRKPVLLVVDDDPAIHLLFQRLYARGPISLLEARRGREGLTSVRERQPDVLVLDVKLPDASGIEIFQEIQALDRRLPVIFITTSTASETAIEAMTLGAFDYLMKPLDLAKVEELVSRALESGRRMTVPVAVAEAGEPGESADVLIGRSPAMQEVYKAIGRVAPRDVTVLIRGDSGTGKELVARALYHHSQRAAGPFLAINCAAIPESLLESELFGHEEGAFTGADRRRIGKFEQCAGGTLFLDEIGDMPLPLQGKILRVLQEKEFERVGGEEALRADVRIIAATHRDLERAMAEGQFRQDLFYRLNVYAIHLKPLRERLEDLELLVSYFLDRLGSELGKESLQLGSGVLEMLREYSWPGNVRELQSVFKQAIINCSGSVILKEHLPDFLASGEGAGERIESDSSASSRLEEFVDERLGAGTENLHAESVAFVEEYMLRRLLSVTGGNQSRVAKILGITRGSVRTKIRALGIDLESYLPGSELSASEDPED